MANLTTVKLGYNREFVITEFVITEFDCIFINYNFFKEHFTLFLLHSAQENIFIGET
jgi:hypothetical protein